MAFEALDNLFRKNDQSEEGNKPKTKLENTAQEQGSVNSKPETDEVYGQEVPTAENEEPVLEEGDVATLEQNPIKSIDKIYSELKLSHENNSGVEGDSVAVELSNSSKIKDKLMKFVWQKKFGRIISNDEWENMKSGHDFRDQTSSLTDLEVWEAALNDKGINLDDTMTPSEKEAFIKDKLRRAQWNKAIAPREVSDETWEGMRRGPTLDEELNKYPLSQEEIWMAAQKDSLNKTIEVNEDSMQPEAEPVDDIENDNSDIGNSAPEKSLDNNETTVEEELGNEEPDTNEEPNSEDGENSSSENDSELSPESQQVVDQLVKLFDSDSRLVDTVIEAEKKSNEEGEEILKELADNQEERKKLDEEREQLEDRMQGVVDGTTTARNVLDSLGVDTTSEFPDDVTSIDLDGDGIPDFDTNSEPTNAKEWFGKRWFGKEARKRRREKLIGRSRNNPNYENTLRAQLNKALEAHNKEKAEEVRKKNEQLIKDAKIAGLSIATTLIGPVVTFLGGAFGTTYGLAKGGFDLWGGMGSKLVGMLDKLTVEAHDQVSMFKGATKIATGTALREAIKAGSEVEEVKDYLAGQNSEQIKRLEDQVEKLTKAVQALLESQQKNQ